MRVFEKVRSFRSSRVQPLPPPPKVQFGGRSIKEEVSSVSIHPSSFSLLLLLLSVQLLHSLFSSSYFFKFFFPSPFIPSLPSPTQASFHSCVPPLPHTKKERKKKRKTFINVSTSTLPRTRSRPQNYSIVQGSRKIYRVDPRGRDWGDKGAGQQFCPNKTKQNKNQ